MNTCDLCKRNDAPFNGLLCPVCLEAVSRAISAAGIIDRDGARREWFQGAKLKEIEETTRVWSGK